MQRHSAKDLHDISGISFIKEKFVRSIILIICFMFYMVPGFSSTDCLKGKWKLDKNASWNIDALLKAQGKNWVERQTITSMDVIQYISTDANSVTIKAVTSIKTNISILYLDNKERVADNPFGGKMKVKSSFQNDGKGISLYSREDGADYHTITRRYCADKGSVMYVEFTLIKDSGDIVKGGRVFRRVD
jgi:hypothetical protein